ncbi:hypothetical protein Rrhod_0469 [Rhodococcus rhodnii LMG 5362]|uniref:Cell division protein FtsL n=1 Tax=Rhodococcus rhodnii LMG 5362 TaxID=1273125 RepID=R7WVF2_9NOCA|nr:hypothetical protein Rrhod_0469 [Rhodococcus rhodnii LMG 5362]
MSSSAGTSGTLVGRVPFVAIVLALLVCGLAVTLVLTTRSAENSYRLGAAMEHNQSLSEQKAALARDVESANSAPQLANRAAELGMVPAIDPARLIVHPDGAVDVVGTPAPAEGTPAPPLDRPVSGSVTTPSHPDVRSSGPGRGSATPHTGNDREIAAQEGQLVPVSPRSDSAEPAEAPQTDDAERAESAPAGAVPASDAPGD